MKQERIIEYDGQTYTWDGNRWHDSSFLVPPASIIMKLNAIIQESLSEEDSTISNIQDLLSRARSARDAMQHKRAENLARRVLEISPGYMGALAILCSALRASGKPRQALDETEAFSKTQYQPLLNSRAAAFCDLNRWEDAKKEIGKSLAIGHNEEAFLVVKRIKQFRPDLYKKEE